MKTFEICYCAMYDDKTLLDKRKPFATAYIVAEDKDSAIAELDKAFGMCKLIISSISEYK